MTEPSTVRADHWSVVRGWLDRFQGDEPAALVVPGATSRELIRLRGLGSLAGRLLKELSVDESAVAAVLAVPGVQAWLSDRAPVPPEVIHAANQLIRADTETALARMYATAVSGRSRRRLGTFFTPEAEVDRMISAWRGFGAPDPTSVVDVGAGVGIYTVAAATAWPSCRVHAVDVNPVTLGLLGLGVATKRALAMPAEDAPGIRLVHDEYVEWATNRWSELAGPRLVLGNPPYTRMQLLPAQDRTRLVEAAGGLVGSRGSLASFITAASLRLLEPGDGLCLLLPAQWLESDYASGLREWLWRATERVVSLQLFPSDLFDDAQVDAVSLLVLPETARTQPLMIDGPALHRRNELDRTGEPPVEWRSLFDASAPPRSDRPSGTPERCTQPTGGTGAESQPHRTPAPRPDVRLSDLAKVRRGAATGANWFFVVSDEVRADFGLPSHLLRRLVRRLRGEPDAGTTIAEIASLLVASHSDRQRYPALDDYARHGEEHEAQEAVLCSRRGTWFDLSADLHTPDLIFSPMSQGEFRLCENIDGAVILNNLYGITWLDETSDDDRARATTALQSSKTQAAIRSLARNQAGGLYKVEPRAFAGIRLVLT